ncbi:MAG: helix-hairpin-helix domain-containing protein [Bacteroidota bacterium]
MNNKEISKILTLHSKLLEFYGANTFKIRGYSNALESLKSMQKPLEELSQQEIESIEGIGKSIAGSIIEIIQTGTLSELSENLEKTPETLIELLFIRGLGPKKTRTIWDELGADSLEEVLSAAKQNKLSKLKGFGEKTQEKIKKALEFKLDARGKYKYAEVEGLANHLVEQVEELLPASKVSLVGELRRKEIIIDKIELLVGVSDPFESFAKLASLEGLELDHRNSGPFVLRGKLANVSLKVEIHISQKEHYYARLFELTGSELHIAQLEVEGRPIQKNLFKRTYQDEKEIYSLNGYSFVEPEMREGLFEIELSKKDQLPELVENEDLKGILHNHSTYSDGNNTLEEMAEHCLDLGYEYLGMTDHSQSAFYADGLDVNQIRKQHQEIDELNTRLSPFKIFKGIESDILSDGRLDYPEEVLSSFDFIVSSIHSGLDMDIKKATNRLLAAIENPYTTILGHMTGRLVLEREGYPVDHKVVIEACAKNDVIIEINASPWRLDIDWKWVHYAMEKGVMLSINPDAHEKAGYDDMKYGVLAGRKGGLTKEMTLNALSLKEIEKVFTKKNNTEN